MSINNKKLIPYHFVPVDICKAIQDTPVWHDGKERNEEKTYSGELNCTITALTPLIVGNYVYNYEDYTHHGKLTEANKSKKVIEPLRLEDEDGRVLIHGTSIKGMLRHSISALMSSPMERVTEHTFSYRPNSYINPNFNKKLTTCGVFIKSISENEISVIIIPNNDILWIKRDKSIKFENDHKNEINNGKLLNFNKALKLKNSKILAGRPFVKKDTSYHIMRYYGSVDGDNGYLMKNFAEKENESIKEPYKYILFPDYGNNHNEKEVNIKMADFEHFINILKHLKDETYGHISNHPQITRKKDDNEKVYYNDVVEALKKLIEEIEKIKNGENNKIALFGEYDNKSKKLITFGHHFRYKWMYKDSVQKHNVKYDKDGKPYGKARKILQPIGEELQTPPNTLTAARLLFGYAAESQNISTAGLGQQSDDEQKRQIYSRLAGRVSINTAVELIDKKNNGDRFLKSNSNHEVFLKILGSPKPSAVEHYLTQDKLSKRDDGGVLCTYGDTLDDESAGELKGRKFYFHQPEAASDRQCYEAVGESKEVKEVREGAQASIARFVSKPDTKFKFKMRFSNLRKWELELLILSLNLNVNTLKQLAEGNKDVQDMINEVSNGKPAYAHKLGHGRPLGLGSVKIDIDNMRLNEKEQQLVEKKIDEFIKDNTLLNKIKDQPGHGNVLYEWQENVLFEWLRVHQYSGRTRSEYPVYYKDGKGKDKELTIFGYHTKIRGIHLEGRKQSTTMNESLVEYVNNLPVHKDMNDIKTIFNKNKSGGKQNQTKNSGNKSHGKENHKDYEGGYKAFKNLKLPNSNKGKGKKKK